MHLYVAVRGTVGVVRQWEADLMGKYYPYEYEPGQIGNAQLGVRRVQLYEIEFPEGAQEKVLRQVWPYGTRYRLFGAFLRRVLHLKPVPKVNMPRLPVYEDGILAPHVAVEGIGIRGDKWRCHKCPRSIILHDDLRDKHGKCEKCGSNLIEFL